jgi:serine phosphatase RsbU (regulator of sigma subunit)
MDTRPKIVIVDDEPKVTQSLEREIRLEFGDERFSVVCFNDPVEALPVIEANGGSIFLVISDLRMPGMNGGAFLAKVRDTCPEAQTMLLTAYTDIDSIQSAIAASIQNLLFKPWTRESITTEVSKALDVWTLRRENGLLRKRIDEMLESVGDFQKRLFSKDIPETSRFAFDISFTPHETFHCGGDFYDITKGGSEEEDGDIMLILGDVLGHGPKSAMIAAMIKTAISFLMHNDPALRKAPDKMLTVLNGQLCAMLSSSPETLVAIAAVSINEKEKTLAVATAGCPPVIHVRAGMPEPLSTPNKVLGAIPDTVYYKTERFLAPGDRVILFTDGLTESVPRHFTMPAGDLLARFAKRDDYAADSIIADFRAHLPGQAFTDDATLISLEMLRGEA